MFVADVNNGNIYHFDLNKDRTGLLLNGNLHDKIADNPDGLEKIIFARGFGGITDMEIDLDAFGTLLDYSMIISILHKVTIF